MFWKLVKSDEAVKTVFDHFRNIGIAGAVFAAGAWTLTRPVTGFWGYMNIASGASLCVIGVFLFCVAERHGHRKFKEAKIPWYWELAVTLVYGPALIFLFVTAALKIQIS